MNHEAEFLVTMKQHILIVEDDQAVRDSMAEFITLSGFDCQVASSAEEAIDILKSSEFQVVITDITMPGMDGLELTDIIKKDYDIDVIVMTGYSGQYSYEEAIGKGASDFVFKPIRFQELVLRLKRVFKERELRQERNRMMADLQQLAITDNLTQLYNSRHFFAQLKMEVDRANRYGYSLALLLLDIDFFKNYNDTFGHLGEKNSRSFYLIQTAKRRKPWLTGFSTHSISSLFAHPRIDPFGLP